MVKKIGKYEIGKTLGSGSFSKVKTAVNSENGITYAIKIIDKELLAKEHMEEQLKREIAVLKVLKHKNVVQMEEVLQTGKHIYLVLELVSGGELFDKIVESKKFSEDIGRAYFQQLVLGVRYCHVQGVAHRDLKPENLLLDAKGDLKISDFGLSNVQRGGPQGTGPTLMQTVCGTPSYVAPEVLKERGYNGPMADIWSCGVILFVMLSGYLPFDDPNMNALFNKIERGEYRMARHFSESVRDLISKMLVVDPLKRITMEGVVAHPWFLENFDKNMMNEGLFTQPKTEEISQVEEIDGPASPKSGGSQGPGSPGSPGFSPLRGGGGSGEIVDIAKVQHDAFGMSFRLLSNLYYPISLSASQGLARGVHRRNFLTSADAKTSVTEITKALETMRCNPKSKEGQLEVKGFANAKKGLLTFVVHVLSTSSPRISLVEIRRGRGDTNDFAEFQTNLCDQLGGLVCSKEVPL